jgi:hypothetical protein
MKGAPLRWAPVLRAHFRLGCKGDKHSSLFAYSISDEKKVFKHFYEDKERTKFSAPSMGSFFAAKRPSLKLKFHFFRKSFSS